MVVASSNRLLTLVADLLLADASLSAAPLGGRIYLNVAPVTATYPVLILDGVSGIDLNTANGIHVMQNATFQVTVRGKGGTSTATLQTIMEDATAVLVGTVRYTASGIYVARIRRIREIPRPPDVENNVVYPQLVAEFYCEVASA